MKQKIQKKITHSFHRLLLFVDLYVFHFEKARKTQGNSVLA